MKKKDKLEVLVNVPMTDQEILPNLLLGKKPTERIVKMSQEEYKSIKYFATIGLILTGIATGIAVYNHVEKYHEGSFSQAYKSEIEKMNKAPLNFH